MNDKHTPGPWQYHGGVVEAPINGTSPPTIICERIIAGERGYGPLAERQAVADADGRLIAAAPELLAALERAAVMLERVTRRGAFVVGCDAAAKQARAALAKAGQS